MEQKLLRNTVGKISNKLEERNNMDRQNQKLINIKNHFDKEEYNYVTYYLTPLRILQALCLSPKRIAFCEKTQKFQLRGTSFQRIFCSCIHIILWIFSIPTIWGSFIHGSARNNPAGLFKMFNGILWTSNVYVLTYLGYFQQQEVLNVLSRPKIKSEKSSLRRHLVPMLTLTIIILHTVPELFITPWDLSVHPWHYYLELNLFAWAHDMLNGFSINPMTVRFGDASLAEKIILVLSVTFTIVRDYVGYVFYILLLISCAGVYEISTKLERSVKDIQKSSCGQIKDQIAQYFIAKSYIEDINKITSPVMLIAFTSAISFTCMRFISIFDGGNWAYGVMIGSFVLLWLIGMILSAEAHAKMKRVKSELRQYRVEIRKCCCKESCDWYPASFYLDSDSESIGLNGGSIFTVSYSLLGQALSIFCTYLVIMIQFESQR